MVRFKDTQYADDILDFDCRELGDLLQYSQIYIEEVYGVNLVKFSNFNFANNYLLSDARKLVDEGADRVAYLTSFEAFKWYISKYMHNDLSLFISDNPLVAPPAILLWVGRILPIMHLEYQMYTHEILQQHTLKEFVEWFETGHLLDTYDFVERMKCKFN